MLAPENTKPMTEMLHDLTKASKLFSCHGQGAESFLREFQTFAKRDFLSFLKDLRDTVNKDMIK